MTFICSTWHPQRWLKPRLDNPLSVRITPMAGKLMLAVCWQFGCSRVWEQGALLLLQWASPQFLGLLHWVIVEFPEQIPQEIQTKDGGIFTLSLEITYCHFHCSWVGGIPKSHSHEEKDKDSTHEAVARSYYIMSLPNQKYSYVLILVYVLRKGAQHSYILKLILNLPR